MYQSPKLERFGTLRELTQGMGPVGVDDPLFPCRANQQGPGTGVENGRS